MKTLIKGEWVVGYDGTNLTLNKDFEVVFEGNKVIYVGSRFEGQVDETIVAKDSLVSPGFIDTHVHSGYRALHKLISDIGRPDIYGQPYMEVAIARRGTRIEGYPNFVSAQEARQEPSLELHALYTVAELLRNGVTTFVELGSRPVVQEALWRQCIRLGVRGYLGPGYDSGKWVGGADGQLEAEWDEQDGIRQFNEAIAFIKRAQVENGELVFGILVPHLIEMCTPDLLRRTAEASREMKVPMATHAAYSVVEFHEIVRRHRMTSIELLESVGMLCPQLNIGHGNLIADHPRFSYSGARDLELMGSHGVSISHCPINIIRRARTLDSWEKYRKAGVNVTIGSDTYPRDMMMNMRTASYMGKVMSNNLKAATAGEVFAAGTIAGAKSLGREDLGRLAPGCKADIIIINLTGRDTLRMGPVRDPIRNVVECGVGDDVDTAIVNGVVRMRGGKIIGLDLEEIRREAQVVADRLWSRLQEWDPLGRTADDMAPLSFCPSLPQHHHR
jgi:5-methylthioadenosine/S-adenosylhomocysteine deaminase